MQVLHVVENFLRFVRLLRIYDKTFNAVKQITVQLRQRRFKKLRYLYAGTVYCVP